jgi:hypothetical protein
VIDPGLAEAEHTHDRVSENTDSTKIIVEPRIDDFIMSSQLHNLDEWKGIDNGNNSIANIPNESDLKISVLKKVEFEQPPTLPSDESSILFLI